MRLCAERKLRAQLKWVYERRAWMKPRSVELREMRARDYAAHCFFESPDGKALYEAVMKMGKERTHV